MQQYLNYYLDKKYNYEKYGGLAFLGGVFFLPSALGLSVIFFIISLIISFLKPVNFLKDKWNYPFFISGLFIFLSTIIHFKIPRLYEGLELDPNLSLLGLINWIPLFICFCGFQKYLDTPEKRIFTAKILIAGSIPVIFSGTLQLLNINGPFQFLNGFVVWFQKPLSEVGSITGLFNNQNYAGLWMVMVWPFCLFEFKKNYIVPLHKYLISFITIAFIIFICLTDSRNAILGLMISSPIVLGTSSLIWYLPTIIIFIALLGIAVIPIFPNDLQSFVRSIIPPRFYTNFPEIGFEQLATYPRINKWSAAIGFIVKRPLFGWGAASFPILYRVKSGEWFGHAHNLPIELALSYGIIPSLIIFSTFTLLLYLSFKKTFNKLYINDFKKIHVFQKAWCASTLIFLFSHLFDIQYFDARISILSWILLSGLRTFLKENLVTKA